MFSITSYAASTAVTKSGAIPVAASTRPPLEINLPSLEITAPAKCTKALISPSSIFISEP